MTHFIKTVGNYVPKGLSLILGWEIQVFMINIYIYIYILTKISMVVAAAAVVVFVVYVFVPAAVVVPFRIIILLYVKKRGT